MTGCRALGIGAILTGWTCLAFSACSSAPLVPYMADTPPLILVPSRLAGVTDQRARFREIFCSVLEAHGHDLPDYRPCDQALTRVGAEPVPTGRPIELGPARRHLVAGFVPGLGWECMSSWLQAGMTAAKHVGKYGYEFKLIEVGGLKGSEENARRIRDAVLAMKLEGGERRLVLFGYSKGAPDILEAIVRYPEIRDFVAAVVSVAGAIGGSPLANSAKTSQVNLVTHFPGSECKKSDDGAVLDSLRPGVRRAWLARNPLPPDVPYYSVVTFPEPGRISSVLKGSYEKLSRIDGRNDSQLIFYDQLIPGSSLVAYVNADHWALTVPINRAHSTIGSLFTTENAYPREALTEAILRFVEEDLEAREDPRGR